MPKKMIMKDILIEKVWEKIVKDAANGYSDAFAHCMCFTRNIAILWHFCTFQIKEIR